MALSRGRPNELPQDAVTLTPQEALRYQRKIVSNWDKLSEVWAIRYTPSILASMAIGTGVMVNTHYRTKFRLGGYGRFSTYLPIVVLPALFTMSFHQSFVQNAVLLRPIEQCPLCLQMRAATFQIGFGVLHPTILAPLAASFFATRHYTYRMPLLTQEPLEVLKLLQKFTKPILPVLSLIAAGQAILTIYLTYKQQLQIFNVQIKLGQAEKEIEQELGYQ